MPAPSPIPAEPPTPPAPSGARAVAPLLAALLGATVLALYAQTAQFGLLNFDDNQYFSEIPAPSAGLTFGNLVWAFTHGHVGQWHPLTTLSLLLDVSLTGLTGGGAHLHNALLHAAAAALLFGALRALTGSLWRSAFVAAVFALHPLRVESVAWVAERKDVLSGVFYMATLWAYAVAARRAPAPGRLALTTVLFALGLLCKSMLVTLPLVLLLLDVWPLRRWRAPLGSESGGDGPAAGGESLRSLLREKIPLFALALLAGLVALLAQGRPFDPIPPLALGPRLAYLPVSYAAYLGQLLWPFGLSAHYPHSADGPALAAWLGSASLLAGVTWLVVKWRRSQPALLVGWLWFLLTLLPVIGVFYSGVQLRADRYTYLSQIGLVFAGVWSVAPWVGTRLALRVRLAAAGLLLLGLAALSWHQIQFWKSDLALWRHAVAATDGNAYALSKLGKALQDAGDLPAAEQTYRAALRFNPATIEALNNLANLLGQRGQLDEAIALQRHGVALFPHWHLMHHNLAQHLRAKGDTVAARQSFLRAVALDATDVSARLALAALLSEGPTDATNLDAARTYAEQAVRLRPDLPEPHYLLGNLRYHLGRTSDAVASYRLALKLDPRHTRAANNLAVLLSQSGQRDEAIALFRQAIASDGTLLDSYRNLAQLLVQRGAPADAITVWHAALQRAPNDVPSLVRLAWLLATSPVAAVRSGTEALALARRADELTSGRDPAALDALAAAQAETGRFAEAEATVQRALALPALDPTSPQARQIKQRQALYQRGQPFRDPAAP